MRNIRQMHKKDSLKYSDKCFKSIKVMTRISEKVSKMKETMKHVKTKYSVIS